MGCHIELRQLKRSSVNIYYLIYIVYQIFTGKSSSLTMEPKQIRMNSNSGRERSLSERTLSGLGWSYLSTFIKALLSLLVLVILARLLTPVDLGCLPLPGFFILLGARFGQSVVGPAFVQRYELTDRHIEVGFTLSVASGIAIMPIIWVLAPLVGEFFNDRGRRGFSRCYR